MKRPHLRPKTPLLEGKVQHHGRFAFLISEDPEKEDILLRGPGLRLALDGDRVQARLLGEQGGRRTGEILRVLQRARSTVVGALRRSGARWTVVPEEGQAEDAADVLACAPGLSPREGEVAVLRVTRWPDAKVRMGGMLQEILGPARRPGVRVLAVLRTRELPDAFPPAVLEESARFPEKVSADMWRGRLELFDLPVFTIDGADAKDFDDAVSLEPAGRHLRLGVHIADVSHYVRKGSALDQEALKRATSVYMADRVVPMLPPKLSDHLCSLLPETERLTLSCLIELDEQGRIHSARFAESVIRSWRRFTYEEVEELLQGRPVPRVHPKVVETVRHMGRLAKQLYWRRIERGALDFVMPDYKVIVDSKGSPLRVERRARLDSHRLIEEFMLAANEAAARTLKTAGAPLLHRIHENPDPAKLELLGRELEKMGLGAPTSMAASPTKGIQELLRRAQGHPLEEAISFAAVRSMRQAVYSARPDVHFGLASEAYTHFTSPIRRYPDLFNHRGLRALLKTGRPQPGAPKRRWDYAEGVDVAKLAAHCSERERLAVDAERQSVDLLRAELLRRRVGETFEGVVSRNTPMGLFVALPETGAVGLVRKARPVPMGSKVRVRLDRVNEGKGELELSLKSHL